MKKFDHKTAFLKREHRRKERRDDLIAQAARDIADHRRRIIIVQECNNAEEHRQSEATLGDSGC